MIVFSDSKLMSSTNLPVLAIKISDSLIDPLVIKFPNLAMKRDGHLSGQPA